jgi:nicotinamidase-related amidase
MRQINGIDVLTIIDEIVDAAHTAVLVIDMQNYMVSPEGEHSLAGTDTSAIEAAVPQIRRLLEAARDAGVLVTYTEHIMQSRLGVNLVAPPLLYQLQRRRARSVTHIIEDTWAARTTPQLAPQDGDIVFQKTTSYGGSAMYHTVLDDALRMRGIQSLILTGALTEGCVLRTAVDTVQHGYYAVIVPECVCSIESENHELALAWMRTRFPVFNLDDVISTWEGSV